MFQVCHPGCPQICTHPSLGSWVVAGGRGSASNLSLSLASFPCPQHISFLLFLINSFRKALKQVSGWREGWGAEEKAFSVGGTA